MDRNRGARFSPDAIGLAWKDLRQNWNWTLTYAIVLASGFIGTGLDAFQPMPLDARAALLSRFLAAAATSIIVTVLTATYQREYLAQMRGVRPEFRRMFATFGFEERLLTLGIIYHLSRWAVWYLVANPLRLEEPEARLIFELLAALIAFPFVFAPLFVIDQENGVIGALSNSARLVWRSPLQLLWTLVLANIYAMAGLVLCLVGVVFTAPIPTLTLARLYEDNRSPSPLKEGTS